MERIALTIETFPGRHEGTQILRLSGPFTLATLFEFQNLVRTTPYQLTIIDLSGVPYMDSAALGALLGFHVSCERTGRHYALTGVSDRLNSLLRMTGVDALLVTCASPDDAEARSASA